MSQKTRLDRLEQHANLGHAWVLQVVWPEDKPADAPPGSIRIILHWERSTQ
jgi:hypothetical protein